MNRFTLKDLFLDALYQVLDNLGFRILLVLFLVPVAMSFLIQFGGQEISFLWIWDVRYVEDDGLLFGRETSGAPAWLHDWAGPEQRIKVPQWNPLTRSLNLSTCVGIATYEALRQLRGPG